MMQDWIGRSQLLTTTLDPEIARRYAAAVGSPLDVEAHFPPMGHWAYFNDTAGPADIGPDGHPKRGRFLPPVALPRRMFAQSSLRFEAPLELGESAELGMTIADVRQRSGRTGELVLVDVLRELTQGGRLRITETQTLVFREAGETTPPVAETLADTGAAGEGEVWRPTVVDLFRYSAATFNSHRIHYDRTYVRDEEGYPDLVVHGPFTATRLFDLATRRAGARIVHFNFRAQAPLFFGQPIVLRAGEGPNSVEAVRCDGAVAMSAAFEA
jgi:3-methylfumaryl-CoA hydratase